MKKAKIDHLVNPPLMKVKSLGYQAIPWVFNQLSKEDQQELLETLMYIAGVVRIDTTTTTFEKFYSRKSPFMITSKDEIKRAYWYWSQISDQTTKIIDLAYDYHLLCLSADNYTTKWCKQKEEMMWIHFSPWDFHIDDGNEHICVWDVMQGGDLDKLRAAGWKIKDF